MNFVSVNFLNRWCLRVSGYPSNHKYVALSTCIFAVTFIITRNICAVPFWYFVLYDMHHHTTEAQRIFLTNVFKRYFILGVGLDILNLFWGVIICSMLWRSIKVLRNLMNKKSE
uniref:SJCHGC05713 protein n=1 Tax=Schistosoma japonicum TaxID=6182 RepID=Q5DHC2_SCHJA|nr:SJCHGC05713 protein [Schistosoma japonicum]